MGQQQTAWYHTRTQGELICFVSVVQLEIMKDVQVLSLANGYQLLPSSSGQKNTALSTAKISISIYQVTKCHIPEDSNLIMYVPKRDGP
jgi:hypothetical protein